MPSLNEIRKPKAREDVKSYKAYLAEHGMLQPVFSGVNAKKERDAWKRKIIEKAKQAQSGFFVFFF